MWWLVSFEWSSPFSDLIPDHLLLENADSSAELHPTLISYHYTIVEDFSSLYHLHPLAPRSGLFLVPAEFLITIQRRPRGSPPRTGV